MIGRLAELRGRVSSRWLAFGVAMAYVVGSLTLGIVPSHIQYENGFAVRAPDYRRIVLSSATYGGHDAVEWEFEHRDGVTVAHVRSLYWRVDGKEFFLLASAPAAQWAEMKSIYDAM